MEAKDDVEASPLQARDQQQVDHAEGSSAPAPTPTPEEAQGIAATPEEEASEGYYTLASRLINSIVTGPDAIPRSAAAAVEDVEEQSGDSNDLDAGETQSLSFEIIGEDDGIEEEAEEVEQEEEDVEQEEEEVGQGQGLEAQYLIDGDYSGDDDEEEEEEDLEAGEVEQQQEDAQPQQPVRFTPAERLEMLSGYAQSALCQKCMLIRPRHQYFCLNRHTICEDCFFGLAPETKCPFCRGAYHEQILVHRDLGKEKRIRELIQAKIVQKCGHQNCDIYFRDAGALREHGATCKNRTIVERSGDWADVSRLLLSVVALLLSCCMCVYILSYAFVGNWATILSHGLQD